MIPRSVMVLGHKITIKQTEKFPVEDAERDILGLADILEETIYLHKNLPAKARNKVLIHELAHMGLYLSGASQSISPEIEETLCQMFANLYVELKRQGI